MATRNKARKAALSNAVTPEAAHAIANDLEEAVNLLHAILGYADELVEESRRVGHIGMAIDLAARKAGYLADKSRSALGLDAVPLCGGLEAWHGIKATSHSTQDVVAAGG